jgi:hypothetical protein
MMNDDWKIGERDDGKIGDGGRLQTGAMQRLKMMEMKFFSGKIRCEIQRLLIKKIRD